MNRCFQARLIPTCASWLLGCCLALAHLSSVAQTTHLPTAQARVRPFPAHALRATLVVTQAPNILIDGKPDRLSPGARIHASNNMLVLPASITGQQLLVNFVREPIGLVHEVWILTEAEARQEHPLATPRPYSN